MLSLSSAVQAARRLLSKAVTAALGNQRVAESVQEFGVAPAGSLPFVLEAGVAPAGSWANAGLGVYGIIS